MKASNHSLHAATPRKDGQPWEVHHRTAYTSADDRPGGRRWLTTLPAKTGVVRESLLGTLSDMRAQLAYLYQADDKVIVRALLGERQIRAELAPLDHETTRIVVVTLKDGDVDRALSSRIVETVEANLP